MFTFALSNIKIIHMGQIASAGINAISQQATNDANLRSVQNTNATNYAIAQQTNEANKALAEYSFQQNYNLWKESNDYNSPAAQMKRLEEAGLNPNLVYGSGSVVGNTSTQTPQYKAPQMHGATMQAYQAVNPFGQASQDIANVMNAESNRKNANTSAELSKSQQAVMQADAASKMADRAIKNMELLNWKAKEPYLADLAKISTDAARLGLKQAEENITSTHLSNYSQDWTNKNILPVQLDGMMLSNALTSANTDLTQKKAAALGVEMAQMRASINLMAQQAGYNRELAISERGVNRSEKASRIGKMAAEVQNITSQTNLNNLRNDMEKLDYNYFVNHGLSKFEAESALQRRNIILNTLGGTVKAGAAAGAAVLFKNKF